MGEGVHGGVRQNVSGGACQIFPIQQGQIGKDTVGNGALFLQRRAGQHRYGSDLRAGAAGGGDADDGQRIRFRMGVEQIALVRLTVAHHQGDGLCRVHGGAAAHADDEITAPTQPQIPGPHDGFHRGVFLHLVEVGPLDSMGCKGPGHIMK